MRAGFVEMSEGCKVPNLEVICNSIEPIYVESRLATKKYKKVSKQAKFRLLRCIENGWSIINVSKKFGINYSTAKSIVQSQKKRRGNGDFKTCSTEQFDSQDFQIEL